MYASTALAQDALSRAAEATVGGADALAAALHDLPAPLYVTNADGFVTYFNPACIGFSGRTPAVGKDRWCMTWKLHTDAGVFLPHDECPMAIALKERREVRGVTAIAERPDGTRVSFVPFPIPVFDAECRLVGAVNMLIDITELRQVPDLRYQAARARRLAGDISDRSAATNLRGMVDELEVKAARLVAACPYVAAA